MEKELKIDIPEGYEIDKENSTFERIRFKRSGKWEYDGRNQITGCWIDTDASIIQIKCTNKPANRNVFSTEKQAKSSVAMAQISQIMVNDERFGGPITDDEWNDEYLLKYTIYRYKGHIESGTGAGYYNFLAFHTKEQCDLFLEENDDLVKDYLMID